MENSLTIYSEKTIFSMLMHYTQHQNQMVALLKEDYFENIKIKEMFKILTQLRTKNNFPINWKFYLQNLALLIQDGKTFLRISDIAGLEEDYDSYPMFYEYIKTMKKTYSKKKVKSLIKDLHKSADNESLDEIIELCNEINKESYHVDNAVSIQDSLKLNKDKAFSISIGEIKPELLFSGYRYLDFCTQGWLTGEFIVISARMGMGKTRFATSLIESICNCGLNKDEGIYFFSLEESVEKITNMIVAKKTGINSRRMKSYNLGKSLNDYLNCDIDCKLFIDNCRHEATIGKLRKTIQIYKENGVKNYFIDTMNVMKKNPSETEKQALDNMAQAFKGLALEFNVRIFVLCQNNRESEKKDRKNKEPLKSDIKGSDEIASNADSVIGLFKPAYYDKEIINTEEDVYCVNVIKTRDGLETLIQMDYDLGTCTFNEKYNKFIDDLIKNQELSEVYTK